MISLAASIAFLALGGQSHSHFVIKTLKSGSGPAIKLRQEAYVEYVGKLSTGKVFDSTKGRGPFNFILGFNQVIPGWEKGVLGMKVGETRLLTIPPSLGYGARSVGDGLIPPNSTLIFRVKLDKIVDPLSLLKVNVLTQGAGLKANLGDEVTVDYEAKVKGGKVFDSSKTTGHPIPIVIGSPHVISGISLGLLGIKVGEKREVTIPGHYGFGDREVQGVPANSTLVFTMECIAMKKHSK